MKYIYSTATHNRLYHLSDGRKLFINGHSGLADKKTLLTKFGAKTEVSEADYALLKDDYTFNKHIKAGFITVANSNTSTEKVVKDMTKNDKSTQKTKEDLAQISKATIVKDNE